MSETTFPYDGIAYAAIEWRKFFRAMYTTGIIMADDNLSVTHGTGMHTMLGTGSAFIDGQLYTNDEELELTHDPAHATLNRIDRIVVRRSIAEKDTYAYVLKGTPGVSPVAPALTQTVDGTYEICPADVYIAAAATACGTITPNIDDDTLCGVSASRHELDLSALSALIADVEAQWALAGAYPYHASAHAPGGTDELTSIFSAIAMTGNYGVFSGGAVTAKGTPDQTVAVSAGSIITPEGKPYPFNAVAALAATAADATNPRIDIVYVSSAGVVTYLAGTAAGSPAQPSTPANGTLLATIARAANDNTIATADITDQRDFITVASDFEDVNAVTESLNTFTCNFAKKHTKNFSFSITNTTGKTIWFSNVPSGTCDTILTIKATGTAAVTWTLDSRTVVWPAGAPTLTSGYTYLILLSYIPSLGKWIGLAQLGAAN